MTHCSRNIGSSICPQVYANNLKLPATQVVYNDLATNADF